MKNILCLLWGTILLVGSGCSTAPSTDYSKVNLQSAGGTVTLDGEPVEAAVVVFESVDTGSFSYAQTDSSGNYTLQFDSEENGVTVGEKIVRISTTRKILGLNTDDSSEGEGGESSAEEGSSPKQRDKELFPPCYNGKSQLKVTVDESQSTYNFDLTSDCSTTGATS